MRQPLWSLAARVGWGSFSLVELSKMATRSDSAERVRKALWNLATIQQLRVVIEQLLEETESLLSPLADPNDEGPNEPQPFIPRRQS
jgi:hypothetical protein